MARQMDVQYINYYCAGSAALKVAPAIPLNTLELPQKKRAKKVVVRVDPIACAGIFLSAVMIVLLAVGFVRFSNARAEAATMSAYVETLQEENEALRAEFEAGYNLDDVKSVALALGMVPEDQLRHITVPADEPIQEEAEPGVWSNFWASVVDLFA